MEDFMAMLASMSWQASIVLVVVLAIRKLFEKLHIPKKFMMLLWMIPFFCLIFPWKISLPKGFWKVAPTEMSAEKMTAEGTQISFLHMGREEQDADTASAQGMADLSEAGYANSAQQSQGSQASDSAGMQNKGTQASDSLKAQDQGTQMSNPVKSAQNHSANSDMSAESRTEAGITGSSPQSQPRQAKHGILSVLVIAWGTGVLILLVCNGIWYIHLKRRLLCSIQVDEQLYVSDGTDTPMVFGVIKPRIYIPTGLPDAYRRYVVAHERTHIKHFHVLYKMAAYAVTCIHWFNPLVWYAFRLLDRDMEMACDEETVRALGMDEQKAYASALLGVANGSILRNKILFVAPVAFEEGNVKARIKNIMSYKKTVTAVAVGAVICCAAVAAIFLTKEKPEAKGSIASLEKVKNTIVSSKEKEIKAAALKEARKHYKDFVEQVEDAIADNFQSVSTEELGISEVFNNGVKTDVRTLGYSIVDIDGDGTCELLFGANEEEHETGVIYDIYTLKDGEIHKVAGGNESNCYRLCNGGIIANERYQENGTSENVYYAYKGGKLSLIEAVMYDGVKSAGQTWYYNDKQVSSDGAASITLEQVNDIINQYAYSERTFMPFADVDSDGQPRITPVSYPDNDNLTFADLEGVQFLFSSGAGAWLTVVTIEADGTFHGYYSDTDAGTGDYMNPWGNKAESRFSGKFSEMEKVAPYEYRMTCEKLGVHGSIGEQRLEDGLLITTTEPYGFDDAGEFRLYLPGKDATQLPEGYLSWSHEFARSGALDCYGLYNVGGKQGYIVRSDLDYSSLDSDLMPSPPDILPLEEDDNMTKPGNLIDKVENANKGSSYLAVKKGYYDEFALRDLEGKGFSDNEYVELTFGEDGTFKGHCSQYRDLRGEDYPRGIREECYYNGRVASVTKTGEYEYTLKLEDIQIETPGNLGDERIEDGMKVITTLPYGISNTDELIVYIPGKSIRELPKPFVQQARRDGLSYAEKADGIVDQYVIYNPGEERGFVRALRLGL